MSILTITDVRARCIVDRETGCWHWQGALSTDGVPRIHTLDYGRADKRSMSGPLAVWHITYQCPPAAGHLVFRRCQHNLCLNPSHLDQAASRAAIGAHIRRIGTRKGKTTEKRIANLRLAHAACGLTPTPDDIVLAIRAVPRAEATNRTLALKHGLSEQVVSRIRRGESRRDVVAPALGGHAA